MKSLNESELNKLKLLILKFKEYMEMENFSERTINDYVYQLKYFLEYLIDKDIETILDINREIVYCYQMYLYNYRKDKKPLSLETQYSRLVPLKSFYRYLAKQKYIVNDPTIDLELPKRKKNLPSGIMTEKEINKILNQPNPDLILGIRDKAILELLYSSAIRNTELRKLTIYDIEMTDNQIRINQGKGRKDRIIPLGEIAIKYIERYLRESRPKLLEGFEPTKRIKEPEKQKLLFISKNGRQLTMASLITIITKYVRLAGIKKHITPHSFRHTCATHMLKRKAGLRYIQELLGHGSIATTQVYTHIELNDLKKEHKRTHPRENKL